MDWIHSHWEQIGLGYMMVHTFAKSIVDATKTKKDNKIFDVVSNILNYLFLGKRTK